MEQESAKAQGIARPEVEEERFRAAVDLLYLSMLVALYATSLLYPLFGIIFGAVFVTSGIYPKTKKVGYICLILGIINLVLTIILFIGFFLVGGLLGGLAEEFPSW